MIVITIHNDIFYVKDIISIHNGNGIMFDRLNQDGTVSILISTIKYILNDPYL